MGLQVALGRQPRVRRGQAELLRMQNGGCRADDGCYDPAAPVPGRRLPVPRGERHRRRRPTSRCSRRTGSSSVGGVKVGFIGMTLKGTPDIVTASGVAGLTFNDEVADGQHLRRTCCKLQGVKAIVVLLHQGGQPASSAYNYDCNANGPGTGLTGDIVPIAQQLDPADRRGRHRPHAHRLRLRHPRPGRPAATGHQRLLVRPAVHRHRGSATTRATQRLRPLVADRDTT